MKPVVKVLFVGTILFIFLFLAAYIFISIKAKPLIISNLQRLTGKQVSVGNLDLKFPLNLELRNLNIQDLAKIDYIYLSTSMLGALTGNIVFNEVKVEGPQIYIERQPRGAISETVTQDIVADKAATVTKKRFPRIVFKHFSLEDGKIDFFDKTRGTEGIKLTLKDLYFNMDNLFLLPKSVIANFQLKGKIPWHQGSQEGSIEAKGWLNLFKKDIRASLNIKNIDGIYLYPYYSNWVDLEKSRIQQVRLNFTSEISGHNNDVVADCHLQLTDIVFRPKDEQEAEEKAYKITTAVIDLFTALDGSINLDFKVRTKMDRPEFGFNNIRTAVEERVAQSKKEGTIEGILSLPTKLIENTIKGATDITKALVSGTLAVAMEIKKGTQEIFSKEEKPE